MNNISVCCRFFNFVIKKQLRVFQFYFNDYLGVINITLPGKGAGKPTGALVNRIYQYFLDTLHLTLVQTKVSDRELLLRLSRSTSKQILNTDGLQCLSQNCLLAQYRLATSIFLPSFMLL